VASDGGRVKSDCALRSGMFAEGMPGAGAEGRGARGHVKREFGRAAGPVGHRWMDLWMR
jgi:hypothetical protein